MSHQVTVLPSGVQFDVEPGETVFAAARRQGYRWPTICQGKATCTACHMLVVSGVDGLAPSGPREIERLAQLGRVVDRRGLWRLACQTELTADARVEKPGVRLRAPTPAPVASPTETDQLQRRPG